MSDPPTNHTPCFTRDFCFTSIAFAYPTHPDTPVLPGDDMYLLARETTYIVGSSWCRKSTIGALLLGQYTLPPSEGNGNLLLDEQDIVRYLDTTWVRRHVEGAVQGSVAQGSFGEVHIGTLHLALSEAVDMLKMSYAKKFVRLVGLPCSNHDAVLAGSGGAEARGGGVTLSSGMRQRLALARTRIRNPDELNLSHFSFCLFIHTRD